MPPGLRVGGMRKTVLRRYSCATSWVYFPAGLTLVAGNHHDPARVLHETLEQALPIIIGHGNTPGTHVLARPPQRHQTQVRLECLREHRLELERGFVGEITRQERQPARFGIGHGESTCR